MTVISTSIAITLISICLLLSSVNAFVATNRASLTSASSIVKHLNALSPSAVATLEDMSNKYSILGNTATPEADAERKKMEEVMEKYSTYKEIKKMMGKLRNMWKNEQSERRKAKQLKSFVDLFKGRLEIEEIIKGMLGLPVNKTGSVAIPELDEVSKWDNEIAELQKKLKEVEMTMPTGMSTRDERFRV